MSIEFRPHTGEMGMRMPHVRCWAMIEVPSMGIARFVAALLVVMTGASAFAGAERGHATDPVPALIEQLKTGSDEARWEAVRVLGKVGDRRAVEPLIGAVVRGTARVGRPAVNLLDRLEPNWRATAAGRNAFDLLLVRLDDRDSRIRKQAVFSIRMFRTTRAAEPLIALLADKDENVRSAAVRAVPGIVDDRAVRPLIRQLVESRWPLWDNILRALREIEPQWYRRGEAKALVPVFLARLEEGGAAPWEVDVLGELRDERAVDPLIAKLETMFGKTSRSCERIVVALGKLGHPRAVTPLVRRLAVTPRKRIHISDGGDERQFNSRTRARLHEEWELRDRNEIVSVLDRLNPDWRKTDIAAKTAGMLVEQLTDTEANVRERAACVLGELSYAAASDLLIERLKDEDLRVRESACLSLAKLRAADVLPALTRRLKDREEENCMRVLAAQTLGGLADRRAVVPLMTALLDDNPSVRRAAAEAVGKLGDKRAVALLLEATKDRYHAVREAAGLALGGIGDTRVVPPLIRQLESPESKHRHGAAMALGALKDPRGIEALIGRLERDRQAGVPQWGPQALGESRSPRAVDFLCSLLDDHRAQVNLWAARALGKIGDPRAVMPLIGALTGDGVDLEHAAKALGELGDARAVEPLLPLLLDERENVRWSAATALRKITGEDFGTNGSAWKTWRRTGI